MVVQSEPGSQCDCRLSLLPHPVGRPGARDLEPGLSPPALISQAAPKQGVPRSRSLRRGRVCSARTQKIQGHYRVTTTPCRLIRERVIQSQHGLVEDSKTVAPLDRGHMRLQSNDRSEESGTTRIRRVAHPAKSHAVCRSARPCRGLQVRGTRCSMRDLMSVLMLTFAFTNHAHPARNETQ